MGENMRQIRLSRRPRLAVFAFTAATFGLAAGPAWSAGEPEAPTEIGLPENMIFFFSGSECPAGSTRNVAAEGRMLLAISVPDLNGGIKGDPLADKEDRTHTHELTLQMWLPHQRIIAFSSDKANKQATRKGTHFSDPVTTDPATSALPFIQLLVCTAN